MTNDTPTPPANDSPSDGETDGPSRATQREAIRHFDFVDAFKPHPIWRGGLLQTLSIKMIRSELDPPNDPRCQSFDLDDDQTPPDTMSGYYLQTESNSNRDSRPMPTVVVLHGMGGHALSGYMLSAAETFLSNGYRVLLWNNRGAGGSARRCKRLHHPGYTDDLRRLFKHLSEHHPDWIDSGMFALAFSLGANLLLKYMGETGRDCPLDGAAVVSAPIDLQSTSTNLRSGANRLFDRYLLYKQRQELMRPSAGLDDADRDRVSSASSVWELDDAFTAPRFGYDSATDFYKHNSAGPFVGDITKPTLLIHAQDDPVVTMESFQTQPFNEGGPLFPALLPTGGHTGFYASDGTRWHETVAIDFARWVFDDDRG